MRIFSQYLMDVLACFAANDLRVSHARFDGVTQVPDFAKLTFSALD
jgi:hypothetical protein